MENPIDRLVPNPFADLNTRIDELRSEGADIIRLDIGSPDLPPPDEVIETLSRSARDPHHHGYQSHQGTQALRQAWADNYYHHYGLVINPRNVLPLLGSKEGIFHLSQALLNPGDVVLVPDPGYQTYTQGALLAGAETFPVPLRGRNAYLPNFQAIPPDVAERAKLLWLNYPNNPTGAVAPLGFFSQAVNFCHDHGILLCHDAAYIRIAFEGYLPPSVLQVPGAEEVAIEFNTLSKSHNMAGWRVGAAVGSPEVLSALLKIKTHADSGHFRPVLDAATAALNGEQTWISERNAIYQKRRDAVAQGLNTLGLSFNVPRASLYLWASVPGSLSSMEFTRNILDKAHVSLAPGNIFGQQGEGYMRISIVQPLDRIEEAMQRIQHILPEIRNV